MRTLLTALLLAAASGGAHAQTCDDFKDRLDAALKTVKLDADLTYRVSDSNPESEFIEGMGDARIGIWCKDGDLKQFSGSSYEANQRPFYKLGQAVLIATGVEKSPRKAETIANRVRAAAKKAEGGSKWEEIKGYTVEVSHFTGGNGEQFRVDAPSP